MPSYSLLYEKDHLHGKNQKKPEKNDQPDFFADLNLDQIVKVVTAGKKEYRLAPFFYQPLRDPDAVNYRQEVIRDLENNSLRTKIQLFAGKMREVRALAATKKLEYEYHKKGWFLEAALLYCEVVETLTRDLQKARLNSRGLSIFREYMEAYISASNFRSLSYSARNVKTAMADIKYDVILQSGKFTVKPHAEEADYSMEIEEVFKKFKRDGAQEYLIKFHEKRGMNHIEAKILEFVAKLFPEPFSVLDVFCLQHQSFIDPVIQSFDREIQFYLSYLDAIAELKQRGLSFCYPRVSVSDKEEHLIDGFDLALARVLSSQDQTVICNDFFLKDQERILVVTGPNQGGKTTFARMFGQVHYLAALGLPVPGKEARLFLPDQILTHFERQEEAGNLRSKLEDDLSRAHEILLSTSSDSLLVLNEIFSSTTFKDALYLSRKIRTQIIKIDALCVWVTFIDELTDYPDKLVSMAATVRSGKSDDRTFKVVRKPADGLAYALSLAKKYRLTSEDIRESIR